jgi:hypothetical protein
MALRGDDVFMIGCRSISRTRREDEETGFGLVRRSVGPASFTRRCSTRTRVSAPLRQWGRDFPHVPAAGRDARCYDPFYWEDVEWGVRAWREGLLVIFCPRSRAAHKHRATTARFYPEQEIDRIVQRNRLLFDARHGISNHAAQTVMTNICKLSYETQREVAQLRRAAGVFRHRLLSRRAPLVSAPPALPGPSGKTTELAPSFTYRLRSASTSARA